MNLSRKLDVLILIAFAAAGILEIVSQQYLFAMVWWVLFLAGVILHSEYVKHHHLPKPSAQAYLLYLIIILCGGILLVRMFMMLLHVLI